MPRGYRSAPYQIAKDAADRANGAPRQILLTTIDRLNLLDLLYAEIGRMEAEGLEATRQRAHARNKSRKIYAAADKLRKLAQKLED